MVIPAQFDCAANRFSESLAAVKVNGLYGYIDRTGSLKIKPRFANAGSFRNGLAPCLDEPTRKWGYINPKGIWVISPRFIAAEKFCDGYARVGLYRNIQRVPQLMYILEIPWAVIDVNGDVIGRDPQYEESLDKQSPNDFGLRSVRNPYTGLEVNITATFDVNSNRPQVKSESGLWGFLNKHGDLATPLVFKQVYEFSDGFARVVYPNGELLIIGMNGEPLWSSLESCYGRTSEYRNWYAVEGELHR